MADRAGATRKASGLDLTQLAWLTPLVAILVALRRPTQDNSYLWHIEAGRRQIEAGSVFTSDPFTFTAGGEAWRTQSWLVELLYGWSEGLSPLLSAPVVVGLAAAVLMTAVGLRVARGRGVLGPVATVWVMWLVLGYFTARPVFPSLALFAVLTLVADRRRLRWTVPLLFWVWASIHGGFFMGLGYLALQGLRLRDRRYIVDIVAATVAASLTAHGWGVWETLLTFAGSSGNLDLISEWLPPDFMSLAHLPFLLGVVGLLWLGASGRLEKGDMWVMIPFVLFAFTANRSVPLAAMAIVPFVFPEGEYRVGKTPFPIVLTAAVVVLMVMLPFVVPLEEGAFESRFPVAAADTLEEVRTFHDDNVGGYLIYVGFPEVFVDDRAELFGELYEDFVDARAALPGWEELFEVYDLRQALVRTEDPIRSVLELSGWVVTHEDDNFVVLLDPRSGD